MAVSLAASYLQSASLERRYERCIRVSSRIGLLERGSDDESAVDIHSTLTAFDRRRTEYEAQQRRRAEDVQQNLIDADKRTYRLLQETFLADTEDVFASYQRRRSERADGAEQAKRRFIAQQIAAVTARTHNVITLKRIASTEAQDDVRGSWHTHTAVDTDTDTLASEHDDDNTSDGVVFGALDITSIRRQCDSLLIGSDRDNDADVSVFVSATASSAPSNVYSELIDHIVDSANGPTAPLEEVDPPCFPLSILIIGPPASGKRVVATDLATKFDLAIIHVGDVVEDIRSGKIRAETPEQTALYQTTCAVDELSDDMIGDLLCDAIRRLESDRNRDDVADVPSGGYVGCGFPRNLAQSERIVRRLTGAAEHVDTKPTTRLPHHFDGAETAPATAPSKPLFDCVIELVGDVRGCIRRAIGERTYGAEEFHLEHTHPHADRLISAFLTTSQRVKRRRTRLADECADFVDERCGVLSALAAVSKVQTINVDVTAPTEFARLTSVKENARQIVRSIIRQKETHDSTTLTDSAVLALKLDPQDDDEAIGTALVYRPSANAQFAPICDTRFAQLKSEEYSRMESEYVRKIKGIFHEIRHERARIAEYVYSMKTAVFAIRESSAQRQISKFDSVRATVANTSADQRNDEEVRAALVYAICNVAQDVMSATMTDHRAALRQIDLIRTSAAIETAAAQRIVVLVSNAIQAECKRYATEVNTVADYATLLSQCNVHPQHLIGAAQTALPVPPTPSLPSSASSATRESGAKKSIMKSAPVPTPSTSAPFASALDSIMRAATFAKGLRVSAQQIYDFSRRPASVNACMAAAVETDCDVGRIEQVMCASNADFLRRVDSFVDLGRNLVAFLSAALAGTFECIVNWNNETSKKQIGAAECAAAALIRVVEECECV